MLIRLEELKESNAKIEANIQSFRKEIGHYFESRDEI